MRNLLMATIALVVGAVGYSAAAWAQDTTQGSTVAEKPFTISLTPRLWYQMGNGNTYHSDAFSQSSTDQTKFADYGLSMEVSARSLPNWSLILTGYYGAGSAPARAISFFPSEFTPIPDTKASGVNYSTQSGEFSRYDVELLARYLVAPTISVTGGFRTFNFTDKNIANQTNIFPNTTDGTSSQISTLKSDNQIYLAEIGVLFSAPFTDSGRNLLFGGTTLGLGARTLDTSNFITFSNNPTPRTSRTSVLDFVTSLDIYAGYQFLLTQSIALNIRYRAIILATRKIPGTAEVNHGPEIGITTRF